VHIVWWQKRDVSFLNCGTPARDDCSRPPRRQV